MGGVIKTRQMASNTLTYMFVTKKWCHAQLIICPDAKWFKKKKRRKKAKKKNTKTKQKNRNPNTSVTFKRATVIHNTNKTA